MKSIFNHLWPFRSIKADCGHRARKIGRISAFGETIKTTIRPKDGKIAYCHECLTDMAIRCAWCRKPIFIGDAITLYSPVNEDELKIDDSFVVYIKDPLQLVGCLRPNCAETGGDRAGFWVPPGEVHRVQTAFGALMGDASAKAVIINDVQSSNSKTEIIK